MISFLPVPGKKTFSSRLRHRLTLQQEVQSADGAGGYARSWSDIADIWAEIVPIKGRELAYAAQIESRVTHRIMLRYRDGVNAGMRLLFENRAFNIRYVFDDQANEKVLQILAEEGVAT